MKITFVTHAWLDIRKSWKTGGMEAKGLNELLKEA